MAASGKYNYPRRVSKRGLFGSYVTRLADLVRVCSSGRKCANGVFKDSLRRLALGMRGLFRLRQVEGFQELVKLTFNFAL